MPKIEIKTKDGRKTVSFTGSRLTIGRQSDNNIVLQDRVASRRHCVLEANNNGFTLIDLKSHNGTWLGENRIIEAPLAVGDTFRIGGTYIRLLPNQTPEAVPEDLPVAEIIVEEELIEDRPRPSSRPMDISDRLTVRAMVAGPLSKQLAPLMEACIKVPIPEGAPQVAGDVRLLNRKSEPISLDRAEKSRPAEALLAFRQMLFAAFRVRSTDIHFEPKSDIFAMRFRIDGLLHPVGEVTKKMGLAIMNVIKVLSDIDIAKRSIVQEGSFAIELPNRRVDFRISFTPTVHGQKLALRFLDKGAVPDQFENLGMDLDSVAELMRLCEQDAGMIILSGPTGSGKTTTLYTALKTIDAETRNIVTIEDPVEYDLANTTQISIDPVHDLTFASVLSSILRQDPDVILVGEVRDNETAKMAMQAATTGHLVLTTLHARDTVGTVFRLLDLGVEPFLIANAISMCISQRLVRILCPNCKRPYRPGASLVRRMNLENRPYGDFYQAVGCKQCMDVGYRGRMALFEMLSFSSLVRDVILTSPTISELRKAAGEWMFQSLADSGYRKVIEGVTTFEEVDRVSTMA